MNRIVFVIADTDGDNLVYRIADEEKGLSPTYIVVGWAEKIAFNPYAIYGQRAEEWTGVNKYELSIVVAHVRSGCLVREEG